MQRGKVKGYPIVVTSSYTPAGQLVSWATRSRSRARQMSVLIIFVAVKRAKVKLIRISRQLGGGIGRRDEARERERDKTQA